MRIYKNQGRAATSHYPYSFIITIIILIFFLGLLAPKASAGNTLYSHGGSTTAQQVRTSSVTREAANKAAPGSTVRAYQTLIYTDSDGMKMTYYLFVPTNYNPQQKYPLVLLLHGVGERADPKATFAQNRARLLNSYYTQVWISPAIQQQWASFIVIPQVVTPGRWVNVPAAATSYTLAAEPTDSLRMAKEIVDMVQQEYRGIDAHRLYVTGLSMGGYGTWDAIERWPGYFAAAAPLSAAGDPSKAALLVDLPIWAFHGTKDTIVPVSGTRDMIQAIIQAGGHPRYTEYPHDGHDLWAPGKVYSPSADSAFFTWLFSQKRS